jgi:BirA family biotin operon repressor/biotin-[acetyl-CoA-carboxylase] ligase
MAEPTMRGNWRVYHHASLDSTNLEALRLAAREALPWTAVVADTQTQGRGRLGRTWIDVPRSCLLLTALVYAPTDAEGLLGPAMALSVARCLVEMGATGSAIKWPNDVLLDGRKVAGILAEGPVNGLMAVGIGLNANGDADELPPEVRERATFLSNRLDREVDLLALADELLGRFEHYHLRLMSGEDAAMVEEIRAFDCLAGREIRACFGQDAIEGRVVGWTDEGRLAIIDGDGDEVELDAGEVTLS